jgi:hypothetical protein
MEQLTQTQINWRKRMIKLYNERKWKVYSPNLKQWFATRINEMQLELMTGRRLTK